MMKKRVVLAVAVLLVAATLGGCVTVSLGPQGWGPNQGVSVRGTGQVVSFPVETASFSAVEIDGNYEIIYRQAQVSSVRFEIHENLIEYLDVETHGGTLVIRSDAFFEGNSSPTLYIYAPQLDSVEISGAGRLRNWDTLATESLSIMIGGAVEGNMPLNVEHLDALIAGAVRVQLTGSADTASITLAGAGDVSAGMLQTRSASVDIAGAGNVVIAASDTLDVSIAGVGRVQYVGEPTVTRNIAGAGTVTRSS